MPKYLTNAVLCAAFFFAPCFAAAQTYRVYRPVPRLFPAAQEGAESAPWAEVSASGVLSAGEVNDADGCALSRVMWGVRLRALARLSDIFSAGIEVQTLKAADKENEFLTHMHKESVSAVIKWNITPQTDPRLYLLFSGGMTYSRTAMEFASRDMDGRSVVWGAGVGGELPLGRGWRLAGEYRVNYEVSPWQNFMVCAPSRWRREFSAGVSFSF